MSDGDLIDLMGDVEILPAGDTDLKTQEQRGQLLSGPLHRIMEGKSESVEAEFEKVCLHNLFRGK